MRRIALLIIILMALVLAATVAAQASVTFAVIGDYGSGTTPEGKVAALVKSWQPDFIITTGDNNYPSGAATTIDRNIGKFYAPFIGNYKGRYGSGSAVNRFWPSLGNHDYYSGGGKPYFSYFTLPGNERWYTVDYGLVRLWALDSQKWGAAQADWLRAGLAASDACYDVVYFHHAPYTSGPHEDMLRMRLPYAEWGAEMVAAGHNHHYERLQVGGLTYFVNGSGGGRLYGFRAIDPASIARYRASYGAMKVMATPDGMTVQFWNVAGVLVDEAAIEPGC